MKLDRLKLDRRVGRLLEEFWGTTPGGTTPGGTIGVALDGELVVHRCAGMASLEMGVPIGTESCFRIASVSKQFTCAAVLKLAAEGRLSVNDDIRLHLPELPDLGLITIDMIMRNMSGIRDMLEIMRQGGMDLGVPCRPEDLLAAICRQTDTNFPIGERFLYSNSNFLLAGLIVERISGVSLRDYLQTHFFTPLGMGSTRVTPQTAEVIPGLVAGYMPSEGGYLRAPHAFPLAGEGGLVSCVTDLALWSAALSEGVVDLAGLVTQGNFTGGVVNAYARGLVVSRYRGVRIEDHGGSWPGFRTQFLRAPEFGATVVAIFNNGAIDASKYAFVALDAVIDGKPSVHAVPAMPAVDALKPLAGRYLDAAVPMTLEIAVTDQGGVTLNAFGNPMGAKAVGDGRLVAGKGAFAMTVRAVGDGVELELPSGHVQSFARIAGEVALPAGLDGAYRCGDMAATWTIAGETLRVDGPHVLGRMLSVSGIAGDVVRVNAPSLLYPTWFDVRAERDAAGVVTGLVVHGGRTKRLVYRRV